MTLDSLSAWWSSLDPVFVFLVCLPFAVAAAGLARLALERRAPPSASPARTANAIADA